MKQIWRVARREVKGYFDHPTAYILLIAFLLLALFVAFRTLYGTGAASLRTVFVLLPWLFAIFIPAMTMRSLAEERRSGTLDWLASQPLSELELLLGKLLGNLLFVLTTLVGTLPTAIGVLLISDADPGIMAAQYIGAVLLAAQMTAIGVWASSATRNQVTAFILGLAVSWTLVFLGEPLLLTALPDRAAAWASNLSILTHFEAVARGVLDVRDLLYFASTALLFGTLAYGTLVRRRLSRMRSGHRRLRIGTAAIVVAVVAINAAGSGLRQRIDLTSQGLYSLSDATRDVLRSLDDQVTVKLFASRALPPDVQRTVRDVRDLLGDFRSASGGRIRTEELRPDTDPEAEKEAVSYGLRPLQFSSLRGDEFQVRRGWLGIVIQYAEEKQTFPVLQQTDDLEYRLIASIASLTSGKRPSIAFLSGFDARTPYSYNIWRDILESRYQTVSVFGDSVAMPPLRRDSIDVLVVAGPRQAVAPAVVGRVEEYLDAGGPVLFLLDRTDVGVAQVARSIDTGFEALLAGRGVGLAPGIVFDLKSNEVVSRGERDGRPYSAPFPPWPHVLRGSSHPATAGLSSLTLGWPGALEVADTVAQQVLWTTTEAAGRHQTAASPVSPDYPFYPDTSSLGKQTVAVAIPEVGTSGRMVVVGDADFLEDRFVRSNVQNLIFATNAIDWLLQDERLIRIRSKDRTPPPLVFATPLERDLFKWGNLIGVPVLVGLFGLIRVLWRRRGVNRR
ncbi:MAG: Gldg family protein [Gemmatimonadales bacterium]